MKRSAFIYSPVLLAILVLGCQNQTGNPTLPSNAKEKGIGTAQRREYGYLNISIRWPKREVQAIPLAANSIVLKMYSGSTLVAGFPLTLTRAAGQSTVTSQALIPTGTNYRLEARAYAETNPTDANTVLALATQAGIQIKTNELTPIALNLGNPNTPFVGDVSPKNAGWGTTLTVTGSNFATGAQVIFNTSASATASFAATFVNSTSLTVNLPSNAVSGPVAVLSNGIYSNNNPTFKAIKSIVVEPTVMPTLLVGNSQTFVAKAYEDLAGTLAIPNPNVTWSASPSNLGSITSAGIFTAIAAGSATVTATSGNVSGSGSFITATPTPAPTATPPTPAPGQLKMPAGNSGGLKASASIPSGNNGGLKASASIPSGNNGGINFNFTVPKGNPGGVRP
jgi:hypothetical protein